MKIQSHEVLNAVIAESDGVKRSCPVIVIEKEETGYTGAKTRVRKGYVPRRESGSAQSITPEDGPSVYYEPAALVDGNWVLAGPDDRGVRSFVTAGSGNGELYHALEAIRRGTAVQAV